MAEVKKYYWLKLKKDFFKRHDIMIIESMPNGKDYVLFYLKLLVESLSHEGNLRFSDTIPYDENMLATITNTNIDIVRSAMKIFESLHLVELMDDKTIFMAELQTMIGSETEWAKKKRLYRQKQLELQAPEVTESIVEKGQKKTLSDKSKSIEIDIEKDIYILFGEYKRIKLTQKQYDKLVGEYGKELIDNQIKLLDEYVEINNNKNKYKNFNLVLRKSIREEWFKKNGLKSKREFKTPEWYGKYEEQLEEINKKESNYSEEERQQIIENAKKLFNK